MILFKIAWRNIFRHRAKTIVIGSILLIGSVVMMIGGATITAMDRSVQEGVVQSFTGELVLMSTNKTDEALFGMSFNAPPLIPQYDQVKKILDSEKIVQAWIPYTGAFLILLTAADNPTGYPSGMYCFGCDIKKYNEMFSNIELLDGRIPAEGERGMLMSVFMRDMNYKFFQDLYYPTNFAFRTNNISEEARAAGQDTLSIKNEVILMGVSDKNSTSDTAVPIMGIYRHKRLASAWREISLIDIESYRQAMNYKKAGDVLELTKNEESLVQVDLADLDAIFGSAASQTEVGTTVADAGSLMKKTSAPAKIDLDDGSWELISIRLKKGEEIQEAKKTLNDQFKKAGLGVKAVDWKAAMGAFSSFIVGIRAALYILVLLIFLVAIVVIMNTLASSTLERSAEFGMMRAVGAQKRFIRLMIVSETFVLSAFFGGLGMISGAVIVPVLKAAKIKVNNDFIQIITGGNLYEPVLSGWDFAIGAVFLLLVTVLATLYPMRLANRIVPLDALQKD